MTVIESLKKSSSQTIQKRFNNPSSDSQTFEETYKTSYSHGLEAIYALENIDIKSIRRIESAPKISPKKTPPIKNAFTSLQGELDLGEEFRGWIPSFIKKEPLQVLELSKHAEKCLIENGFHQLGTLIGINLKDFVFLRGMGQGHIEEVNQKLHDYLDGRELDKCQKIDFFSWLKVLLAAQDRKKVHVLLEPYDLSHHFPLSPSEHVEVRKLSFEKKQEWMEELLAKLVTPQNKQAVQTDMELIFSVFFKPWIRQRQGFATLQELTERMQRISEDKKICHSVIAFFQEHFFEGKDLFSLFLKPIDHDLYSSDDFWQTVYKTIIDQTSTYFYSSKICYGLREITYLLEKEFARSWIGFTEGFIEKVLRLSPRYSLTKGFSGKLEIRPKYFH